MKKISYTNINDFEEQCNKCAVFLYGENKAPFFYSCDYLGCPSSLCVTCFKNTNKNWKLIEGKWKKQFYNPKT